MVWSLLIELIFKWFKKFICHDFLCVSYNIKFLYKTMVWFFFAFLIMHWSCDLNDGLYSELEWKLWGLLVGREGRNVCIYINITTWFRPQHILHPPHFHHSHLNSSFLSCSLPSFHTHQHADWICIPIHCRS